METIAYCGIRLDRAGGRRADGSWLDELLNSTDARLIPLWQDQCLVAGDPPVPVAIPASAAGELRDGAVFLGLDDDGGGVFAADLSGLDGERAVRRAGADRAVDVREIVMSLGAAEAAMIGYARGLLRWHRDLRFCGACGTMTRSEFAGHQRVCGNQDCARLHFPKIEPAVIMAVETDDEPKRILLAHHRGQAAGRYSTLAGFVEVGESLEDAVRREVAEETGVQVTDVTYVASQPWPFPSGLMIGFRATAVTEEVAVDGQEVLEARWFTRAELTEYAAVNPLGRPDSIDRHLLRSWLANSLRSGARDLAGEGRTAPGIWAA
ncbi:MAG TPA: NAD(+) diphosphatase [Streptosporangiaceae bacterium]|nr:NAD(+) diphosphatase [Streptosporangiaceae bacterium]